MFQMRCLIICVMNIFKNMYQFKITQRIHYYSILILEHFSLWSPYSLNKIDSFSTPPPSAKNIQMKV